MVMSSELSECLTKPEDIHHGILRKVLDLGLPIDSPELSERELHGADGTGTLRGIASQHLNHSHYQAAKIVTHIDVAPKVAARNVHALFSRPSQ